MEDYKQTVGQPYSANGDVKNEEWLFEAKTCTKEQQQFTIKKEWLEELKKESFAMNKEYNALVFNFGPDTSNYYIINEKTMKKIINILNDIV